MGASASVSCAAYEGRKIRLLVEQLRYENGQSYVAWRIFSEGGAASYYGIGPITATINGTVVYNKGISYYSGGTASFPVSTGSVNGSLWISHSSSKTITITLDAYVYVDTGEGPFSTTLSLPATGGNGESGGGGSTDYSATPILFVSGGDIGSSCRVAYAPDWEGYSYYLQVQDADGKVYNSVSLKPRSSGVMLEQTIFLPYTLLDGVGVSGTIRIVLVTYRGTASNAWGIKVGQSAWPLDIHVVEDDQTRPQVTSASFSPTPNPLGGAFVQNKTGVQCTITGSGKYGATIASSWFRVEGKDIMMGQASSVLTQYGQVTVMAYVRDSRGFTSLGYPVSVEVLPYSPPKLKPVQGQSKVTAVRCDSKGQIDEDGAYLMVMAKREYSPVMWNGVQRNFCSIRYRWRPDVSDTWSAWTEILSGNSISDSVTTAPMIGTLDPKSAYQVEIQAVDTLGGNSSTVPTVYSDRIYWHRHGALGSLGFGKYVEEANVFDIAGDKTLKVRGSLILMGDALRWLLDFAHPVGSVMETVTAANPGNSLGGTWVMMEQTETTFRWRRSD